MVPIIAIVESSLRKRGGCLPPYARQANSIATDCLVVTRFSNIPSITCI